MGEKGKWCFKPEAHCTLKGNHRVSSLSQEWRARAGETAVVKRPKASVHSHTAACLLTPDLGIHCCLLAWVGTAYTLYTDMHAGITPHIQNSTRT